MAVHQATPVRLNIGAGNKRPEGFLNVGLEEDHDIICDIRSIPLPDNHADEAMAIHVVEHIEHWDVLPMLKDWFRILKPGALLVIEQPDLIKCCQNVLTNPDPQQGIRGLFGDPRMKEPLMMHRYAWSFPELKQTLREAGFVKVKLRPPQFHGARNHRDMRLEARKPA